MTSTLVYMSEYESAVSDFLLVPRCFGFSMCCYKKMELYKCVNSGDADDDEVKTCNAVYLVRKGLVIGLLLLCLHFSQKDHQTRTTPYIWSWG